MGSWTLYYCGEIDWVVTACLSDLLRFKHELTEHVAKWLAVALSRIMADYSECVQQDMGKLVRKCWCVLGIN